MIDNKLYEYMTELLKRTPLDFIRYKYDEINWNGRLVGIIGARGVGKSTMVLQRIKLSTEGHHLYVSADNIYFTNHTLIDFADDFIKEGGTHLYIDEIHKYARLEQRAETDLRHASIPKYRFYRFFRIRYKKR